MAIASPFPRLERLELEVYNALVAFDELRPLLRRTDLTSLTALHLMSDFDHEVVGELATAAFGGQLRELGLYEIDARVATALLALAPRMPALRRVFAVVAHMPAQLAARLRQTFGDVRIDYLDG